ncbi:uncharacterized protein LOC120808235 isoform X1 [Gasterosteus aculeatus]
MEHKLILAVSGFPSLYDTNSPTYRDLNMRADSWRHVSDIVGVPEAECRRKWKTLRDQHRRERQREKDRRESGIGLFNYRPWRYSAILSFLNPFIDARAAGCNGWALDPQPPQLHPSETGCSTTTDTRSDDEDHYGLFYSEGPDVSVVDATTTTTSSSSSSEFLHRKRPSSASRDGAIGFKEAKMESTSGVACVTTTPHDNMRELFEVMMQSVTSLAASLASSSDQPPRPDLRHLPPHRAPPVPPCTASRLNHLKTEEQEAVAAELLDDRTDAEEEEEEEAASTRPTRARSWSSDGLLQEYVRRMEAREAQRDRDLDQRDHVTLFLLSLAPAMRRLPAEKQSWVRTKMQQLLHEAEFGALSFQ